LRILPVPLVPPLDMVAQAAGLVMTEAQLQGSWLEQAGCDWAVWRPQHWENGVILLRFGPDISLLIRALVKRWSK
jgi:hypothetical protein